MYGASFYGWYTYQHASIPAPQGQTITYGLHLPADASSPPSVTVTQYTVQNNSDIVNPYVYLAFATDKIQPGIVSVGLDAGVGAYLVLYHFLNGGSDYCAMAVGFGELNVIAAEKTTAPDGGMLAIGGQAIQLYHPTSTPIGDVSGWVGNICPVQ